MKGLATRAVICVFDGLRRDLVDPVRTPNIHRFATSGTWFTNARSVLPSMTRVATTSFATGAKPETHGIVDNAFFHRSAIPDRALDTSQLAHIDCAEAFHQGNFVPVPGFGCALAEAGRSFFVVHSGSAGSAHFVSHRAARHGHSTFCVHGRDATRTPRIVDEAVARFGPIPEKTRPDHRRMDYAAQLFLEHVLSEARPDVALIWFSEPDTSFHFSGIGSADADAVLSRVDAHFGAVLDAVAASPDADETVVVAMSDHGHLVTREAFDLPGALAAAGMFSGTRPEEGTRLLATAGVTVGFTRTDPTLSLEALVDVLAELPQTGLILSRSAGPGTATVRGTLPYDLVGLDHERAPELVWVGRADDAPDARGFPGTGVVARGTDVPLGGGMHGGLSNAEQNTLLALRGPGVPALGEIADVADLTDIVPTVLSLIGCERPQTMTGHLLPALREEAPQGVEQRVVTVGRGAFGQALTFGTSGGREVVLSGTRLS